MCGVFGFVSRNGRGPNLKRLAQIACVTQTRGPDAFGFAWVDGRGRLRMFKKTGKIGDNLGVLAMAEDARMLIGHCRWATHGEPEANINNHPHPADGGWIVHNGIIRNHESVIAETNQYPVTDCDSEALGVVIETEQGNLIDRCRAAAKTAGKSPFVLLGLWSRPNRLVVVRSGNPLAVGWPDSDRCYFASLPAGLPGDVKTIPDGSITEFTANKVYRADVRTGTEKAKQPTLFRAV